MFLPSKKVLSAIISSSLISAAACGIIYLSRSTVRSLKDTKIGPLDDPMDAKAKFGDVFAYYLLSAEDNLNLRIWRARAEALRRNDNEEDEIEGFFTQIKHDASAETVKRTCKQKYGEEFPKQEATKWKGIWIYCSIGGMQPKTIYETEHEGEEAYKDDSENPTFGRSMKEELISTKDPENNWFWNLRQQEFIEGRIEKNPTTTYFTTRTTESLKALCERAYTMRDPGKGKFSPSGPNRWEIKRYCSIRKVGKPPR